MPRYHLHGKSVIVTGAAGGIGAATVETLVAKGAQVTLVDLAQEAVDEVAAALPAEQVLARAADVTDVENMTAVTAAAVERFGKVDVVFANAGIANTPPTTLAAADLDAYERVIEVDLLGVVRTIKPALPQIIENKGHVLITASVYAFFNGVVNSAYAASKAGVLYPGWVATPIADATRGHNEAVTAIKERAFRGPLGTFIEPEQVAAAAVKGIESRVPRIIEPKRWAPASAFRGIINILSDAVLERDREVLALVHRIDAEERQRRLSSIVS